MAAEIWQLAPLGPPAHDPSASERPRSSWPSLDGTVVGWLWCFISVNNDAVKSDEARWVETQVIPFTGDIPLLSGIRVFT